MCESIGYCQWIEKQQREVVKACTQRAVVMGESETAWARATVWTGRRAAATQRRGNRRPARQRTKKTTTLRSTTGDACRTQTTPEILCRLTPKLSGCAGRSV